MKPESKSEAEKSAAAPNKDGDSSVPAAAKAPVSY